MTATTLCRLVAAFSVALSTAGAALALPGDLDDSFGQQGRVVCPHVSCGGLAPMADGRLVTGVLGPLCQLPGCTPYSGLARYTANGLLDTTFGQGGQVEIPNANGTTTLKALADGKILGIFRNSVMRFNENGSLDAGFGVGGRVDLPFADTGYAGLLIDLLPLADGRVLVVGQYAVSSANGVEGHLGLAMLKADGKADTGFGVGGVVHSELAPYASTAVVTADGRFVVGAGGVVLFKYLPDGRLDTGFGQGGKVSTYFGRDGRVVAGAGDAGFSGNVADLVIQPDGKLLVMAPLCQDRGPWGSACTLGLVRYLADGRLDSSFENGPRDGMWNQSTAHSSALRLEADGRILVAMAGAIYRFNSDGSRDTGYGDNGIVRLASLGIPSFQADGKLLVASNLLSRIVTDQAGQGVVPQAGLWVIDAEAGSSGRGFQIEVQRDLLMMVVNGYEASGASTFHVAGGSYVNSRFTGDLYRYAGGVAIGGTFSYPAAPIPPSHVTGSAGKVTLQFSDPTHGTITLPGEAPKSFHKFDFGVPPTQEMFLKPVTGLWVIAAEKGSPGRGFLLEAQGNSMVMVFDGYTQQGEPTFYYAAAGLNFDPWNNWTADLGMYAGGTSFGGPVRAAHATGSAGQARALFWTATSGCLWLPGDTVDCRPIGKLNFGLQ